MDSRDIEEKQMDVDSERDSLLDIHERQDVSADKEIIHEPDVEAGLQMEGLSTLKASRAPITQQEALTSRINSIDNLRTVTLCVILIHNSAIQAISTHPQADRLHETNPRAFIAITIFSAMARLLAVPMLFFVAGFTAKFAMVMHGRSPLRFVLRRMWKTGLTVLLYQSCAYLARKGRQFPSINTHPSTPYYASREGSDALLNGPTAYILVLFTMDALYALFRWFNIYMARIEQQKHIITSQIRYNVAVSSISGLIQFWVFILGYGLSRQIIPEDSFLQRWMYAANAAELHFPLYPIAYAAGIHFVHYYKYLLWNTKPDRSFSLPLAFFIQGFTFLIFLTIGIGAAKFIGPFFDLRQRPSLVFTPSAVSSVYGVWVLYMLLLVPEATVNLFFDHPPLLVSWGNFSRHVHLQVYVQMAYIVVNPISVFDGVFARWIIGALTGMWYAHYLGVGGVAMGNLFVWLWNAMRSRLSRAVTVQPLWV